VGVRTGRVRQQQGNDEPDDRVWPTRCAGCEDHRSHDRHAPQFLMPRDPPRTENSMKAMSAFRLACGALVALASTYAWSQNGKTSVESNGAAMTASGTTTAKATRQANRA